MRIALYHPNLHFMGGGETVALTIASALRKEHEVTIFCIKAVDVPRLEAFFGLPSRFVIKLRKEIISERMTSIRF